MGFQPLPLTIPQTEMSGQTYTVQTDRERRKEVKGGPGKVEATALGCSGFQGDQVTGKVGLLGEVSWLHFNRQAPDKGR